VPRLVFSAKEDKDGAKLNTLWTALNEAASVVLDRHKVSKIPVGRIALAQTLRHVLERNETLPIKERTRILSQKRFWRLCKDNGKINMRSWHKALEFLHLRGALFWRPDLFKGRIILDQSWALRAIYAVFDRTRSLPFLYGDGHFTRQQLAERVWAKRSENMQRTFLSLMESCGICFRYCRPKPEQYPDEWDYVVPELLPVRSSPAVRRQMLGQPKDPATAQAKVRFRFLHEGVLRSFLSWLGNYVGDLAVYWKFGCRFEDRERDIQVIIDSKLDIDREHPGQGTITLDAWGGQSVPLLQRLIAKLKTLSPVQEPEIEPMDFEKLRKRFWSRGREAVAAAQASIQVTGLLEALHAPVEAARTISNKQEQFLLSMRF
jgi:internalin A